MDGPPHLPPCVNPLPACLQSSKRTCHPPFCPTHTLPCLPHLPPTTKQLPRTGSQKNACLLPSLLQHGRQVSSLYTLLSFSSSPPSSYLPSPLSFGTSSSCLYAWIGWISSPKAGTRNRQVPVSLPAKHAKVLVWMVLGMNRHLPAVCQTSPTMACLAWPCLA